MCVLLPGSLSWAAPDCRVERFVLINADTNKAIRPLVDGDVIVLAELPSRRVNIVAETVPPIVSEVTFDLNRMKRYRAENAAPYALAGDRYGNFNPWTPDRGKHTVVAKPRLKGRDCRPARISFEVVERRRQPQAVATATPEKQAVPVVSGTPLPVVTVAPAASAVVTATAEIGATVATVATVATAEVTPEGALDTVEESRAFSRIMESATSGERTGAARVLRYEFPLLPLNGGTEPGKHGTCVVRFDQLIASLTVVCSHTLKTPYEAVLLLAAEVAAPTEVCELGGSGSPFIRSCFLEDPQITALKEGHLYVLVARDEVPLLRGRIAEGPAQAR